MTTTDHRTIVSPEVTPSRRSRWPLTGVLAVAASALVAFTWPRTPVARTPSGHEFYVAPDGKAGSEGTREAPLPLAEALSKNSPARPGDTIWLRGGVYQGPFISYLEGTRDAPIVVRQTPGERATIDSSPSNKDALFVNGAWTWYWGFEITSSAVNRVSVEPFAADIKRGGGIAAHAPGAKFINLVIHDMLNGIGIWISAPDAEVYGSLIYHNGYQAEDRGHGHGIYAQNRDGLQRFTDNILFGGFSHGMHAYGSDQAFLNNIQLEGNIIFNSGVLSPFFARNILIGGGRRAEQPIVQQNYTYFDDTLEHAGGENNFGFRAGCANLTVRGNYWAHIRKYPLVLGDCTGTIENNVFIGWTNDATKSQYPSNTFLTGAPVGTAIFIRPNRFERGRANVVVYNWDNRPQVEADLSTAGLKVGQGFEIRDVQNFFGPPILTGRYSRGRVSIPMTGGAVAPPVGNAPRIPTHTPRTFGAFIVLPLR